MVPFLQHFRQYLLGTPFTICTDHSALTWPQNFKQPEGQLARWLEQLQEYEFTIIHHPGKVHCNADALSRWHCSKDCPDTHSAATIVAVTIPIGYSHAELRQAQLEDPSIGEILQAKQGNRKPATEHGKGQKEVKTLSKLKERFYWPGHYNDVRDWCQTSKACAKRKSPVPGRQAPMQTITAGYPTQVMVVNLLGPLPESKNGNRYVLVIGDYFFRWMEALPVPNQEAVTVAEKLVDEVFLRFSPPEQYAPGSRPTI